MMGHPDQKSTFVQPRHIVNIASDIFWWICLDFDQICCCGGLGVQLQQEEFPMSTSPPILIVYIFIIARHPYLAR